MAYRCAVSSCRYKKQITLDRQLIFRHYLTHLKQDVVSAAAEIGIVNPNFENRYSLINLIIDKTPEVSR